MRLWIVADASKIDPSARDELGRRSVVRRGLSRRLKAGVVSLLALAPFVRVQCVPLRDFSPTPTMAERCRANLARSGSSRVGESNVAIVGVPRRRRWATPGARARGVWRGGAIAAETASAGSRRFVLGRACKVKREGGFLLIRARNRAQERRKTARSTGRGVLRAMARTASGGGASSAVKTSSQLAHSRAAGQQHAGSSQTISEIDLYL